MDFDTTPAKVAGYFYNADKEKLLSDMNEFITPVIQKCNRPLAFIVPHAGHQYSGEISGKAYSILQNFKNEFDTVVLIGPAHHVLVNEPAILNKDYLMPFGKVERNKSIIETLVNEKLAIINDDAHNEEHCLEVQLPFLQYINPQFKVVNILIGPYDLEPVVKLIDRIFKMERTLVIISSDLSHFNTYSMAKEIDYATLKKIVDLNDSEIQDDDACGAMAIRALIKVAKKNFLNCELLGYCNSGDKTANKLKVVGYGSFGFFNS